MFDPEELRTERDRHLAYSLSQHASFLAMGLRDWLQEELRELRPVLEALVPLLSGVVAGRLTIALERLDDIDRRELTEAYTAVKQRCDEIRDGDYEDPLDARLAADEVLWRLEKLVRELMRLRRFADQFVEESRDQSAPDA